MKVIKSSKEISTLFQEGRRVSTPTVNLIIRKTQRDQSGRVAFIAGKKQGNAVWRNRAKRRMRALCFELGGPFDNYDVLFIAKSGIENAPYNEVFNQIQRALIKVGLLHD